MKRLVLPLWTATTALALLTACNETTTPASLQPIDIALDFCATETPVWFAYQNAGEAWVRVVPDAEGTFHFQAKRRVALAFVRQAGTDYDTQFIGASNFELQSISGLACLDDVGAKQLNGAATGFTGTQLALVGMGFSSVYLTPGQTTFTLTQLADRPLDLMATRFNVSGSTSEVADRVIIRRTQNLVNNATMPTLDFTSGSEGFTPASTSVAVSGVDPAEQTDVYENFFTQQRTSQLLFYEQIATSGNVSVPIVPPAQTAANDYHDLFVTATNGASFRGSESFFRNPPATQLLPIGPVLNVAPTFTTVTSTPYVQLNITQGLTASARYDRAAAFELSQQTGFNSIAVTITVTEGFYNSNPSAWVVTIPDLTGVEGWQNAWGLQAGTPIDWTVTTYFGRPALLFGADPSEGEGIQFAGHSSAPAVRAAAMTRAGFSAPRPRSLSPFR